MNAFLVVGPQISPLSYPEHTRELKPQCSALQVKIRATMAFCPTLSSFRNSRRVTTGTTLLLLPPPSPKIAWEKADPHQTLPEMRQEEAPSIGRTPQKEAPKSALKSLWVWAPQARSARSSVFYDSSKSLEPTAPGSGWIHTTQSIGHASVHSKAAL